MYRNYILFNKNNHGNNSLFKDYCIIQQENFYNHANKDKFKIENNINVHEYFSCSIHIYVDGDTFPNTNEYVLENEEDWIPQ